MVKIPLDVFSNGGLFLLKRIKNTSKTIYGYFEGGKSEDASGTMRAVADNAYFFKRILRQLAVDRKRLASLSADIYGILGEYFRREGFVFSKAALQEALRGYDLTLTEVDMLCSVLLYIAAEEVVAVVERDGGADCIVALTVFMKKCRGSDFSELYYTLSEAERCLAETEEHYKAMTEQTKAMYRRALRRYARRRHLGEAEACMAAARVANSKGEVTGRVLGVERSRVWLPYCICVLLLCAVLIASCYLLCGAFAFLLAVPLISFSFSASDFMFSLHIAPSVCPALSPDKLPPVRALTVITTLLDKKSRVFEDLERYFLTNSERGLIFGVLADLPESATAVSDADGELIFWAKAKIEELNRRHGERFCLLLRGRVENGEGRFCGRERKRGAIEDLVRYIRGGGDMFTLHCGAAVAGVEYLVCLDSDTRPSASSVTRLIGMMLHPLNRAVIRGGRVIHGYGIMQPTVQSCLESSRESRFALMLSGAGGIDVYETAAFNRQQTVFGEGIFCGKGIIDVDVYGKVLDGVLPEGRVLSHDLPEGNILRCRYISELAFYDTVPSAVIPYFKRLHRWVRGDVQNLSLLFSYKQGRRGAIRIIFNVFRHLCPVLALGAMLFGNAWAVGFALLLSVSPLIFTLLSVPLRLRRFFSTVQSAIIHSASVAFFSVCSQVQQSYFVVDAVLRSVWRMLRGRRLLAWVTAAQSELISGKSLAAHVINLLPSVIVGILAFCFSGAWGGRLLGLLWVLFPLYAYYLAGTAARRRVLSEGKREQLKRRAEPIWRFFEENVNASTGHLPPDNIQFSPVEAVAMRTSPTNIGLYLLSVVAAKSFGFIDAEEEKRRLYGSIEAIEALPKWRGHLYNWYSLPEGRVLGTPYISTVDSGNFCVCLVALARYLFGVGRIELSKRVTALYRGADFASLYNSERDLFSLGYDVSTEVLSDICYDLYMSEARSTSYFAVASSQVPTKHWAALGRHTVQSGRHIGMASWSGTAFEYFMPQLLLPLYRDSFAYESLSFALGEQMAFSYGTLWGCSESAYYCFDSDMNYQYKAHGVPSLALTRYEKAEKILSPYSVYLSLCLAPRTALRTLARYDAAGFSGRYGLYEAIDFSDCFEAGAAVESYMAHHMGMSLIASANAYFDSLFVHLFMSDARMGAFYELLQEKVPTDAPIYKAEKLPERSRAVKRRMGEKTLTGQNRACPTMHLLSCGGFTLVADNLGRVSFRKGDISLNRLKYDAFDSSLSPTVLFLGDAVYSATDTAFAKCSFETSDCYAAHICASEAFSGRVKYSIDAHGCFAVETRGVAWKKYSLIFAFDVQMATDKEYFAHPSFADLTVTAEYDATHRIIIYTKRFRGKREALYMAVGFDDGIGFEFETSKENGAELIRERYSCGVGACISPFCLIKTEPISGGSARLLISVGNSRRECVERFMLGRYGQKKPCGRAFGGERESKLLAALFYGRRRFARRSVAFRDLLWSNGISGDYPLIAVKLTGASSDMEYFIRSFCTLAEMGIRTEAVFLLCESDLYSSPLHTELKRLCRRWRCESFWGRRGGIFALDGNDKALCEAVLEYADYCAGTVFGEATALPEIKRRRSVSVLAEGRAVCGGTYAEGFSVDTDVARVSFSYLLVGRWFGSVVTHEGLGFTYFRNASLCRPGASELICSLGDGVRDLCASASRVEYKNGVALYCGEGYSVTVFVCERLPVKAIVIELDSEGELGFCVEPSLGSGVLASRHTALCDLGVKGTVGFTNGFNRGVVGFIGCLGGAVPYLSKAELFGGDSGGVEDAVALRANGRRVVFFIGAAPTSEAAKRIIEIFSRGVEREMKRAVGFARTFLPDMALRGAEPSLEAMLCNFAPYQVAASRFFARAGYYQYGGAFGFRDQLQDCLWLIYVRRDLVRVHLLRAASRQYVDGSVQHWWHPTGAGIKSSCSDDFLWLPICVSDYLEKTGDYGILDISLPYLVSPPLEGERERYEHARHGGVKESLYGHCLRALEHGKLYGVRGLPLIGCCDWNDAFSGFGDGAETVFGAFFFSYALRRFASVARARNDTDVAEDCEREAELMLVRAEACFVGDRYIRAFDGAGNAVGVDGRAACEIDALVQAWAVFAGARNAATAMRTAYGRLYDRERRLLKLFAPAFGLGTEYGGYINAYAEGVRENGGQYTHAAVWFAIACLRCGMVAEGKELLEWINPLRRAEDRELFAAYKTEPYAIVGDIYSAVGHEGRGGWSFYTGAAAWWCKAYIEELFGLHFSEGFTVLTARPLVEFELCMLGIEFKAGTEFSRPMLDGIEASYPLRLDGVKSVYLPLIN